MKEKNRDAESSKLANLSFFVVTLGIKKIDYALHRHKESIT